MPFHMKCKTSIKRVPKVSVNIFHKHNLNNQFDLYLAKIWGKNDIRSKFGYLLS